MSDLFINFPFNRYKCQNDYMKAVIRTLETEGNALLESPTGTGKTLCLLCATLAWQEDYFKKNNVLCKIIYTSRTHNQLSQVIKELKKSIYRPRITVLGSREQLCVHPTISKLKSPKINASCSVSLKTASCSYYEKVEKGEAVLNNTIMDIEELANTGKAEGFCPYFYSRESARQADLVLSPYNYILDVDLRTKMCLEWKNSVLIFDEAHNIESAASDSLSFDISSLDIRGAINELSEILTHGEKYEDGNSTNKWKFKIAEFQELKEKFELLDNALNSIAIPVNGNGVAMQGSYIYNFLSLAQINQSTINKIESTLSSAIDLLLQIEKRNSNVESRLHFLKRSFQICFLKPPKNVKSNQQIPSCSDVSQFFKVYVDYMKTELNYGTSSDIRPRVISFWCQCPGIALEIIKDLGVRSIILTSGTLSPLQCLGYELRLPFQAMLENPHVIDKSQIWVGVCGSGPTGEKLLSTYTNRDSAAYKKELGLSLVNFFKQIPHGILVFFSTYSVMESCINWWKAEGFWGAIENCKEIFIEPRLSSQLPEMIKDYEEKIDDGGGAAFFAVCRGKLSEGMDFSDSKARCVIITGIPFAPINDPKVRLKREYMNQAKSENGVMKVTGEMWYVLSAMRAVNQAIGRTIRHRSDYGAIILCDTRFAERKSQMYISKWIRPYMSNTITYHEVMDGIRDFVCSNQISARQAMPLRGFESSLNTIAPIRSHGNIKFDAHLNDANVSKYGFNNVNMIHERKQKKVKSENVQEMVKQDPDILKYFSAKKSSRPNSLIINRPPTKKQKSNSFSSMLLREAHVPSGCEKILKTEELFEKFKYSENSYSDEKKSASTAAVKTAIIDLVKSNEENELMDVDDVDSSSSVCLHTAHSSLDNEMRTESSNDSRFRSVVKDEYLIEISTDFFPNSSHCSTLSKDSISVNPPSSKHTVRNSKTVDRSNPVHDTKDCLPSCEKRLKREGKEERHVPTLNLFLEEVKSSLSTDRWNDFKKNLEILNSDDRKNLIDLVSPQELKVPKITAYRNILSILENQRCNEFQLRTRFENFIPKPLKQEYNEYSKLTSAKR